MESMESMDRTRGGDDDFEMEDVDVPNGKAVVRAIQEPIVDPNTIVYSNNRPARFATAYYIRLPSYPFSVFRQELMGQNVTSKAWYVSVRFVEALATNKLVSNEILREP